MLENLTPHPTGLTQPWATVIAACIALAAALVAWKSVKSTIKAAADEGKLARQSDKDIARENREAEDRRLLEAERARLLADALHHGQRMFVRAAGVRGQKQTGHSDTDTTLQYNESSTQALVARDMMVVRGLNESADAYLDFVKAVQRYAGNNPQWDVGEVQALRDKVLAAFRRAAASPNLGVDSSVSSPAE